MPNTRGVFGKFSRVLEARNKNPHENRSADLSQSLNVPCGPALALDRFEEGNQDGIS